MPLSVKRFGLLARVIGWAGLLVLFISLAADVQATVMVGLMMIVVSLLLISLSYLGLFRRR